MPAHTIEVTAQSFQKDIVEGSAKAPVLLDFWADWCGPCKTLGPILEKLAAEYGGAFVLGKVDADKEQDLAYAFGVQGIPFCVLVDGGRPVDGFQGALPEAEVRAFLERHGIRPAAGAAPQQEEKAVDPNGPEARLARATLAAAAGDAAAARDALDGFPEEEEPHFDSAQRLLSGLEWLEAELSEGGGEAEQKLLAARQRFLGRDYDGAMAALLESVAADKTLRAGLARKAMLVCFAVVGEEDERLDAYRRRLATLLY